MSCREPTQATFGDVRQNQPSSILEFLWLLLLVAWCWRGANPWYEVLLTHLPIGAGESGKSTILKQMKLIHEGGYSRDERESFKEIIFSNTVQSMRVILEAMESLELPLEDQRMEYHVQTIFMQPAQIEGEVLPPEVGGAIEALWKDRGVEECFKRSREYQLNDSAR